MNALHVYFETGAVGDTAINLCRYNRAMLDGGYDWVVVHTSKFFRYSDPDRIGWSSPVVREILKRATFIHEVVYDIDYTNPSTWTKSRKYGVPIQEPYAKSDHNDIKRLCDLTEFIPDHEPGPLRAIIHPVSLKYKPLTHLDDYVPTWDRCVGMLKEKGYDVVLVGSDEDPVHRTMRPETLDLCTNMIGKWTLLQSLAYAIYRCQWVVACDSWASIWGPAAKVQTVCAWGHRMEYGQDFFITDFMGNRDFYKHGWSSQKEYCDALLAAHIGEKLRQSGQIGS